MSTLRHSTDAGRAEQHPCVGTASLTSLCRPRAVGPRNSLRSESAELGGRWDLAREVGGLGRWPQSTTYSFRWRRHKQMHCALCLLLLLLFLFKKKGAGAKPLEVQFVPTLLIAGCVEAVCSYAVSILCCPLTLSCSTLSHLKIYYYTRRQVSKKGGKKGVTDLFTYLIILPKYTLIK